MFCDSGVYVHLLRFWGLFENQGLTSRLAQAVLISSLLVRWSRVQGSGFRVQGFQTWTCTGCPDKQPPCSKAPPLISWKVNRPSSAAY
jgi:hypothetical protein